MIDCDHQSHFSLWHYICKNIRLAALRFIGDRSIDEKDLYSAERPPFRVEKWSNTVQSMKDKAKFAIVAANNHYMQALVLQLQTPLERCLA
jgi:hypothetical protein